MEQKTVKFLPISPNLYVQMKKRIVELEVQNARLAQDNQILEAKVSVLERMLEKDETILDMLL